MNGDFNTVNSFHSLVRLGKISFANCDFPYYAMEHGKLRTDYIDIIEGHPVELAAKLQAGELDLGPISSIMYAKQDDLLILPGLSKIGRAHV